MEAFDDVAGKDNFLMIIKIAAKFIYKENRLDLAICFLKKNRDRQESRLRVAAPI